MTFLPSFLVPSRLYALDESMLSALSHLLGIWDHTDSCLLEQKGITQQTVKEIVDELVSDGMINMDKM
jgi:hypothetical protein